MTRPILIRLAAALTALNAPECLAAEPNAGEVYSYLESMSLEQLADIDLKSSGLFAINWDKAPGTYYVVERNGFEKYGYRGIGEYLNRAVPGMSTGLHGNQGTIIGVRGMMLDTTSKTLLLRDNHSLNTESLIGINGSKLSTPLTGDIDRIEVALGPSATLHGSGAINGYINMVTATGESRPGVWSKASYGSGDARTFEASYGKVLSGQLNLFFYGGYSHANGVSPYYTVPTELWSSLNGVNGTPSQTFLENVRVGKTDHDYKFAFRAEAGGKKDFAQLDLKVYYAYTSNIDPVLGEYLTNAGTWYEELRAAGDRRRGGYSPFYIQSDRDLMISPTVKLNLNDTNKLEIIPTITFFDPNSRFSDELKDWIEVYNIPLLPKTNCPANNCFDEYNNQGFEDHYSLKFIHSYTGLDNQNIAWGAEGKRSYFKYFDWNWTTAALFGEDQISWDDWTFLAGLRYDKVFYDAFMENIDPYNDGPYPAPPNVDALTKRFAIAYSIDPKQTVKFSYQEGFRWADKWAQHWAQHQAIVNGTPRNGDIAPESSTAFELNYSSVGMLNNQLNFTASLFHNIYEDTHGWIASAFNFGNSPMELVSSGLETEIKFRPNKETDLALSYSYAVPDDSYETSIQIANQDDTWTRYPVHMFKFRGAYEIIDNLTIGTVGQFESPRWNKANTTNPMVSDLFSDWNFVADAFVNYDIDKNWKVQFTAKELVRKHYNQGTAYFQGTRPLDNPRALDPQFYLSVSMAY